MKNKVYLVGAGPGRPDLITVRGLNILKEADVVIYDYLVDKRILENVKEGSELICCDKLGKSRPCAQGRDKKRYSNGFLVHPVRNFASGGGEFNISNGVHQEKISDLVIKKVKEGKKVVRIKNGDISIFSRLSQELEALVRNKIDFELVPGVTAASGAASFAGIPLTDRRIASTCVFVTGHEDPKKEVSSCMEFQCSPHLPSPQRGEEKAAKGEPRQRRGDGVSSMDWEALSKVGTMVFYMAVEKLPEIVKQLIKAGKPKDTGCAIVQNATLDTQKILSGTLLDILKKAKRERIKPPAIIIVGDVVRLGKRFNWLRKNRKILFTGLSKERFFIRGTYFHLPLIKIEPLNDYREFDNYLKNIRNFDWIVFASRYGVEYFFKRLETIGLDTRTISGIKIAAVGNSTARKLKEYSVMADLIPKKESSAGLLREFKKILRPSAISHQPSTKILLPRSDISDKGLEKRLEKLGAAVTTSFAYKNVMPNDLPDLELNTFNEIMFTSPSTVRNFKIRYRRVPKGVKISCIGEVTLKEAKRCNLLD